MENEIIQDIIEQRAAEIENAALELQRKRLEKERHETIARRIKDAERTFWVIVVLGLMIGLAGNQLTEMIASLKDVIDLNRLVITLAFTVLFLGGVYLVFKWEYIRTADEFIRDFFRKDFEE